MENSDEFVYFEGFPDYVTKNFLLENKLIQDEIKSIETFLNPFFYIKIKCEYYTKDLFHVKFFAVKRKYINGFCVGGHIESKKFKIENDLGKKIEMIKRNKGYFNVLPNDIFNLIEYELVN